MFPEDQAFPCERILLPTVDIYLLNYLRVAVVRGEIDRQSAASLAAVFVQEFQPLCPTMETTDKKYGGGDSVLRNAYQKHG